MKKPEQLLADRLRRNLSRFASIERVENLAAAGTPDTHIIMKGNTTWIEHKVAYWPVHENSKIRLNHPMTPEQENWHLAYYSYGGYSFIVIGIEHKMFMIPGHASTKVNNLTKHVMHLYEATYMDIIQVISR